MTVCADERCIDCELEFSSTRRRIAAATMVVVLSTIIFLPITLQLVWSEGPLVYDAGPLISAFSVAILAVAVELSIAGIIHRICRNRFLAQGGHPQLLGGLEVPIAPARADDNQLGREFWDGRSRREPPISPIWGRTYGH
jgi:hypothetical protein